MGRWGRMVLLVAGVAPLLGCAVRTVDCWQLDARDLAAAQARGWCRDAFAPNVQTIVPLGQETGRPSPPRSPRPQALFVPPVPPRKPAA